MRIIILGGDDYLGWPTATHFAARGWEVLAVDNYMRRNIARETSSEALVEAPVWSTARQHSKPLPAKRLT
jgi:UDP-sulfoquinovose synthase